MLPELHAKWAKSIYGLGVDFNDNVSFMLQDILSLY